MKLARPQNYEAEMGPLVGKSLVNIDAFFNQYPQEEEQNYENYQVDPIPLTNPLYEKQVKVDISGFFNEYSRENPDIDELEFNSEMFE